MAPSRSHGTYPQSRFKAAISRKTGHKIARDNTDMLVYLVYMDYLRKLVHCTNGDELTPGSIEKAHEKLMKKYRG